jgi:GTP pyrophosphokinase
MMTTLSAALVAWMLYGTPDSPLGIAQDLIGPPASMALISEPTGQGELSVLAHYTEGLLQEAGLEGLVTARLKSPQSVWSKAQRKGLNPNQVLDRLGLRIRVESTEDCYAVWDRVHAHFAPVQGSQDDYIASPKSNGYQSLHSAVQTPLGIAEFQVRTHAMHRHAESGAAAHRRYKAGEFVGA